MDLYPAVDLPVSQVKYMYKDKPYKLWLANNKNKEEEITWPNVKHEMERERYNVSNVMALGNMVLILKSLVLTEFFRVKITKIK